MLQRAHLKEDFSVATRSTLPVELLALTLTPMPSGVLCRRPNREVPQFGQNFNF